MRPIAIVALTLAAGAWACNQGTVGSGIDGSGVDGSGVDGSSVDGSCGCQIEGDGFAATLVMSWDCYCTAYKSGCTRDIATVCTDFRQRIDYPGCGLTVLRIMSAGGPIDDVFDQDGKLVGAYSSTDTGPFACPSNPSLTGFHMRAGRLPEDSCQGVACGACTSPACSTSDGGGVD